VALYVADLVTAGVALLVLRRCVQRTAAVDGRAPLLRRQELRSLVGMSAGLTWTQAVGLLTRQLDRFVVGGVTSLASLGVYSAGVAAGRLLSLSYAPYLTAVFPESCAIARDAPRDLPAHLLRNSKVVALTCFGVGIPVALCGRELLTAWLGDGRVAAEGDTVLAVYVLGCMLLALADTQYQLHTAMGSTRCGVIVNTAAAVWLPLVMVGLVQWIGIVGAAATWTLYAATTLIAFTVYSFRVLLPGHLGHYLAAVLGPVLALTLLDVGANVLWRMVLPDDAWTVLVAMVPTSVLVLAAVSVRAVGRRELTSLVTRKGPRPPVARTPA
jgi:O-antigen/teichoic acid export membrane protein